MNENAAEKGPIRINLRESKIQVTPGNCLAKPGDRIAVNIEPPQQQSSVRTVAKDSNKDKPGPDNWLNRSNSQANSMTITVPDRAYFDQYWPEVLTGAECPCTYGVEAPGKAPLDPMVTVRK